MTLRFQGIHIWVDEKDVEFICELLPQSLHEGFARWADKTGAIFKASVENRFYRVVMESGCPSLTIEWFGGLSEEEVRDFQQSLGGYSVSYGFMPVGADEKTQRLISEAVAMAEPWDSRLSERG